MGLNIRARFSDRGGGCGPCEVWEACKMKAISPSTESEQMAENARRRTKKWNKKKKSNSNLKCKTSLGRDAPYFNSLIIYLLYVIDMFADIKFNIVTYL
ncbi:hypothetical protein RUM43_000857 [Polyplax serrata]|uniref:Uncharacterized protein n=1 Tax=Polyplax serrata TaxID=468196 RepID=A0AAN8XPP9_POLSC